MGLGYSLEMWHRATDCRSALPTIVFDNRASVSDLPANVDYG
jgi:hypothetical protein